MMATIWADPELLLEIVTYDMISGSRVHPYAIDYCGVTSIV